MKSSQNEFGEWVSFPGEKDEEEVLLKVIQTSKAKRDAAKKNYQSPETIERNFLEKIIDNDRSQKSQDFIAIEKLVEELLLQGTFLEEVFYGIDFDPLAK